MALPIHMPICAPWHVPDSQLACRWLISTAQDQDRVILTSDRFLITAAVSERAYFVRT